MNHRQDGAPAREGLSRWKWSLINDQWFYVISFTAYLGLAGAMGGNPWVGLLSFPFWYGIAVIGRNT